MALNASKVQGNGGEKKFAPQPDMEPGTYPARLVQLIDMGLQPQRAHKGQEKPPAQDVMWTYEFVDCFLVDEEGNDIEDKPRWVSETIPFRSFKADLATSTKRIKALDPDNVHEGDASQLLAAPVNVTITVTKKGDKTYTNIVNTTAMRKRDAEKCPELVNPVKVFSLDDPDMEVFNSLPEWIREKIKGNLNYAGSKLQAALGEKQDKAPDNVPAKKDAAPAKKEAEREIPAGADNEEDIPW